MMIPPLVLDFFFHALHEHAIAERTKRHGLSLLMRFLSHEAPAGGR